jgi:uncharacterized protein (TIGR02145 family)
MKTKLFLLCIPFIFSGCAKDTLIEHKPRQGIFDADSNEYTSVKIGNQTWLKENLKTTRFIDGTYITNIKDDSQWNDLTIPGYCWYYNIENVKGLNGALYNWYAVKDDKLCPVGWHIPTDNEFKELELTLGMDTNEVDLQYWRGEGIKTELQSELNILYVGYRWRNGFFEGFNQQTDLWTSTEYDGNEAIRRSLVTYLTSIYRGPCPKNNGLSVRCIKNN